MESRDVCAVACEFIRLQCRECEFTCVCVCVCVYVCVCV